MATIIEFRKQFHKQLDGKNKRVQTDLLEFRRIFNALYKNLHGSLPEEGDPEYSHMCNAFILAWAVWREARREQK